MIVTILKIALALVAMGILVRQVRRPARLLGSPFLRTMNLSHSALTDWALTHVRIGADESILDVGCGGGRTIGKLAALAPAGKVCGADVSAESVRFSCALNAEAIRAGRVEVRQAGVSKLPYPDATFDLVTAVETHYYWPDLVNDTREIRRVLKPGGRLLVVAESYQGGKDGIAGGAVMKMIGGKRLSVEGHRQMLADAGLVDLEIFEERGKGWIAALGRAPAAASAATPAEPATAER